MEVSSAGDICGDTNDIGDTWGLDLEEQFQHVCAYSSWEHGGVVTENMGW